MFVVPEYALGALIALIAASQLFADKKPWTNLKPK